MSRVQKIQQSLNYLTELIKSLTVIFIALLTLSVFLVKIIDRQRVTYHLHRFSVSAPPNVTIDESAFTGAILRKISDIQQKSNSSFQVTTARIPNGDDIKIDYGNGEFGLNELINFLLNSYTKQTEFSGELFFVDRVPKLNIRRNGDPMYKSPVFSKPENLETVANEAAKTILARIQPQRYAEIIVQQNSLRRSELIVNQQKVDEAIDLIGFLANRATSKTNQQALLFAKSKLEFHRGHLELAILSAISGLKAGEPAFSDPYGLTLLSRLYYFRGKTDESIKKASSAISAWKKLCSNIDSESDSELACLDEHDTNVSSRRALFFSAKGMLEQQKGEQSLFRGERGNARDHFCKAAKYFAKQIEFEKDEYERNDVTWDLVTNVFRGSKCLKINVNSQEKIVQDGVISSFEGPWLLKMYEAQGSGNWRAALENALKAEAVHVKQEPLKEIQRTTMHSPDIALYAAYAKDERTFRRAYREMPILCQRCDQVKADVEVKKFASLIGY
jgi:hypothetical protein